MNNASEAQAKRPRLIKTIRLHFLQSLSVVSDTPQLDVDILLQHVLKKERSFLHSHPEYELTKKEQDELSIYIECRLQCEPIAYIVGETEFWSLPFKVNSDVLIPRPETEKLVERVCEHYKNKKDLRVVDLGTGSGAIAIALAHEFQQWQITATDDSVKALDVAKENAILNNVDIEFIHTHWFSGLPKNHFDIVISNPPYIAKNDPHLHDLTFEPRSALTDEQNGLVMLAEIINAAPAYLKPGGVLMLEHGYNQQADVIRMLEQTKYADIEGYCDDGGNNRFVIARSRR